MKGLWIQDLGVVFGYAFCFFLWHGYQFGGGDQAEHLPWVLKEWDPTLYPGDYYLDFGNGGHFGVRTRYARTLAALANPSTLSWWCFGLTLVCAALGIWAVILWSRALFPGQTITGWLAPFFTHFVFFRYWSLGDNLIAENSFISGTPALAAGLLSLALVYRQRWWMALWPALVAGYFHPIVGFHLCTLVFFLLILARPSGWLWFLGFLATTFFMVQYPFFIQTSQNWAQDTARCAGYTYEDYFIRFRLPHHFLMSTFPASHYIKFGFLMAAFFVVHTLQPPSRSQRTLAGAIAWALVGCALYYFATERIGIPSVFKTQWPKITIWLSAAASIVLASWTEFQIRTSVSRPVLKSAVFAAVPAIILVRIVYAPAEIDWPWSRKNDALARAHRFIGTYTPKDALFITDPANDRFSYEARRPLATGYRAVWPDPNWTCPWFLGFSKAFFVAPDSLRKQHSRLRDLASRHFRQGLWQPQAGSSKARYVLVADSVPCPWTMEALLLYRNESYVVWKLEQ